MLSSRNRRSSVAASFSLTRRITSRMPGTLAKTTVDGKTSYLWTADEGATWASWLHTQRRPRPAGQSASGARAAFSLLRRAAGQPIGKSASLLDPMVGLRWITRAFF